MKIVVPDYFFHKFSQFCSNKWLNNVFDRDKREIITTAIKDAYTRLSKNVLTAATYIP